MTLSLIYFSFSIEKDCDKWYNNYVFEFSERSNRMNGIDTKEKLIGRIENVVYRNESNDYTVLEISDEKELLVTAVGIIPMAFEGEDVVLTGHWTYHKEFGKQFAFDTFEKTLPKEVDGILQYLSSRTVKGIGPVTALKMVNRYGIDTFDVIENHPEWLADIPGITMKKAAEISKSFREQTGIRSVMMFCKDFISTGEITKVYKRYGAGAVEVIKDNPYILCNGELGISFDKVDEMAKRLGQPMDSQNRILSGINYILEYNAITNGHTCLPTEKLVLAAADLLEIPEEHISNMIDLFLHSGDLGRYRINDKEFIMTDRVAEAEDFIAKSLHRLSEGVLRYGMSDIASLMEQVEAKLAITLAPQQKKALYLALDSGVMVLTGGPGTGKTTVIKALISIFNSIGAKVVLAAPTGRAAKRMSEATGEEAKTVHRMLEMDRGVNGENKFFRNSKNPLDENIVIVDEASMLDLFLTEALMRAMKRGARLILIGDSDQLPSVGAGNILFDIISSERINTVKLTEIFRQSKESLIITNAHRINEGTPPVLNITNNDFFFVRRERESDIPDTIASLITERLPRTYGMSIKDKIQVITPSKKGSGGVETLNLALQDKLNPQKEFKREKSAHGTVFREGDRVMQVANNYEIEWEKNGVTGIGLFNGDIGTIIKIDKNKDSMKIDFEDKIVEYSFDLLDELELAYAITVHKSQGSEYPVVIIPMYSCPPMLMSRNLLYTAVTRARRMVILVGRYDIPGRMAQNNREVLRYTTLKSRICDYY